MLQELWGFSAGPWEQTIFPDNIPVWAQVLLPHNSPVLPSGVCSSPECANEHSANQQACLSLRGHCLLSRVLKNLAHVLSFFKKNYSFRWKIKSNPCYFSLTEGRNLFCKKFRIILSIFIRKTAGTIMEDVLKPQVSVRIVILLTSSLSVHEHGIASHSCKFSLMYNHDVLN